MSLAIPRSKRKKIIIIIIILSSRIDADLDNNILDTNAERLMVDISKAQSLFETDPNNWTTEQSDLWNVIEQISDAISDEDEDNVLGNYADDLERVLG